jgi:hypothetical protein
MNRTTRQVALSLTVIALPLLLANCSDNPPPKPVAINTSSGPSPSTSNATPSLETEKAEILKVRKAYGRIFPKFGAGENISMAEIDTLTAEPWRTQLLNYNKSPQAQRPVTQGGFIEQVVKLEVNESQATLAECQDHTKEKTTIGIEKRVLNSPSKPELTNFTFIRTSKGWQISNIKTTRVACTMKEST